jgi:UDP-3-O-[3-hydroxymyristoyl] glucosamine N-acyltransferase
MAALTLSDIAAFLNVPAPAGATARRVTGVATLTEASPDNISFLGSDKYLDEFQATRAAAVLVQKRVKLPPDHGRAVFLVDDADLAVAKLLEQFAPPVPRPPVGRHHSAVVAPTASIGENARIGPNVFIGDDCELFPNVVVRERITIGHRVVIHAGSVLGSDGFGYRWDGSQHRKIPQIGTVVVEDDVEIGSCVCIDRAKFSATRIGRGSKIDNLVQIGHNVTVGPHCIIVGQAGLAGSVLLGTGVVLGGQSAIRDHVRLGDGAAVAACSGVAEDVDPKTVVSGLPALPHRQSLREQAALRRLPDLVVHVRKLQEELDALKKAAAGK